MSNNMISYVFSDAWNGVLRNKGGSIASVLFIALSMSFIGVFFLVRVLLSDVTDYLNTQLSMKVYVEQSVSTDEVATILQSKNFVKSVEVEEGDELLDRLSFFFTERAYLLEAFTDGKVNDAIRLTLTDSTNMVEVATMLERVNGIEKVVYPQELAVTLQNSLEQMTLYGSIITLVLILVTFLMIYTTFHLALYRREKELKVKLLVGMNPQILRLQFLVEGLLLALIGTILAAVAVYIVYAILFSSMDTFLPFLKAATTADYWRSISIAVGAGVLMCLGASYFATRKWIRYA